MFERTPSAARSRCSDGSRVERQAAIERNQLVHVGGPAQLVEPAREFLGSAVRRYEQQDPARLVDAPSPRIPAPSRAGGLVRDRPRPGAALPFRDGGKRGLPPGRDHGRAVPRQAARIAHRSTSAQGTAVDAAANGPRDRPASCGLVQLTRAREQVIEHDALHVSRSYAPGRATAGAPMRSAAGRARRDRSDGHANP